MSSIYNVSRTVTIIYYYDENNNIIYTEQFENIQNIKNIQDKQKNNDNCCVINMNPTSYFHQQNAQYINHVYNKHSVFTPINSPTESSNDCSNPTSPTSQTSPTSPTSFLTYKQRAGMSLRLKGYN